MKKFLHRIPAEYNLAICREKKRVMYQQERGETEMLVRQEQKRSYSLTMRVEAPVMPNLFEIVEKICTIIKTSQDSESRDQRICLKNSLFTLYTILLMLVRWPFPAAFACWTRLEALSFNMLAFSGSDTALAALAGLGLAAAPPRIRRTVALPSMGGQCKEKQHCAVRARNTSSMPEFPIMTDGTSEAPECWPPQNSDSELFWSSLTALPGSFPVNRKKLAEACSESLALLLGTPWQTTTMPEW
jgi:hypothetical protein